MALEKLGQGQEFRADDEIGVVMDAVPERREAEEDTCVRGKSRRRVGEGAAEDDPPSGQRVDHRRLDKLRGVAAQPVRPQRVDGDKKKIRPRGGPGGRRACGGPARRRNGQPSRREEEEKRSAHIPPLLGCVRLLFLQDL
ncbi:MAG: hypothetical protein MZV64_11480 [Ignavibacteriales bacterium]|nr:hypothetical protein [Ignavibacteriales bacterium]MCK7518290.1 hypothetical protein [Ignavibacteriales bacterium]